jgi:hypothetical protein
MNFGKIGSEPWYGKNLCRVERFAPRPNNVKLTGSAFLVVPGAIAPQLKRWGPYGVLHKPQGACGGQNEAERIGAEHAFTLPALVLPEAREGIAVTNRDFHRPPLAILGEDRFQTQCEVGGEKRFHRRRGLPLPWLSDASRCWAADHYHAEHPAGQHGMPDSLPGLNECSGFAGMGLPPASFTSQRFRGPQQRAFLRGTAAAQPPRLRRA